MRIRRGTWTVVLLALAAACGDEPSSSSPRTAASAESPPNVVVVLIDTLRPDHLEAWGRARDTAPFLSELASRSVVFERAWSASSWTAPATASLFTSLYPPQHGITEGFFVHRKRSSVQVEAGKQSISLNRLPDGARTLPEHLVRNGWSTWGITANVNVTERIGFDRGFQKFVDLTGPQFGKGGAADLVLRQLREWKLNLAGAQPYFLYLHLNDVHSPWVDRSGTAARAADALTRDRLSYDGEIRFVDQVLRRAYAELGWDRNTILCVLSDHGEEFMEHGGTGHGFSLYRELLQVVFLIAWPERWHEQVRVDENVSLVDVYPTLAELAGAPFVGGLEGRSAVGAIEGSRSPVERTLFAHRFDAKQPDDLWAVVRGKWKLVAVGRRHELYDTSTDTLEGRDRSAEYPEVVAELEQELAGFRARAVRIGSGPVEVQLNAAEIESLKGLGYTDDGK